MPTKPRARPVAHPGNITPMLHELQRSVLATLRRHRMLPAGSRVGVAVSGGADSVALLLLLEELRAELGASLVVLHFNHQLRGAESDADERLVNELAAARGLECITDRDDVAAHAAGANLEETARRLRYAFFARVVEAGRATHVAVGHTADDQAETVLAHILRGTGTAGLAGIYPVAGDVVRPLLETRRQKLREYLTQRNQGWREDSSNLDTTRLRARIRHKLLPPLEAESGQAVVDHLASLAELARGDEEAWRALLDAVLPPRTERTAEGVRFRISDLSFPFGSLVAGGRPDSGGLRAPEAVQRRIVRRLVEMLAGHRRGLGAQHVEMVLSLAREGRGGAETQLPGGVRVRRTLEGYLEFYLEAKETPLASNSYEYTVELAGRRETRIEVPAIGRRLILKVIDWPGAPSDTREGAETLDFERLRAPLVLRNWRPGDAYRPRGHRSTHKLKRLFWERRIEAADRPAWPVLTSAGRVVWARALPAAQEFAAQSGTRVALWIDEERL